MEEKTILIRSASRGSGGAPSKRASGLATGILFGITAAALVIVAVSVIGVGAHHIVLVSPESQLVPGVVPTSSPGGTSAQGASPGQGERPAAADGVSLLESTYPFVLAAGLGAAFYGLCSRRQDSE